MSQEYIFEQRSAFAELADKLGRSTRRASGVIAGSGNTSAAARESKDTEPPPPPPTQARVVATPSVTLSQALGIPREAVRAVIDEEHGAVDRATTRLIAAQAKSAK